VKGSFASHEQERHRARGRPADLAARAAAWAAETSRFPQGGASAATSGHGGARPQLRHLWRIVYEWRWLILGAVAVALAGAIVVITLLTTPLYRADGDAGDQSATVEIMDEASPAPSGQRTTASYLATQYGLLAAEPGAARGAGAEPPATRIYSRPAPTAPPS
jgi:hypothetical protein